MRKNKGDTKQVVLLSNEEIVDSVNNISETYKLIFDKFVEKGFTTQQSFELLKLVIYKLIE